MQGSAAANIDPVLKPYTHMEKSILISTSRQDDEHIPLLHWHLNGYYISSGLRTPFDIIDKFEALPEKSDHINPPCCRAEVHFLFLKKLFEFVKRLYKMLLYFLSEKERNVRDAAFGTTTARKILSTKRGCKRRLAYRQLEDKKWKLDTWYSPDLEMPVKKRGYPRHPSAAEENHLVPPLGYKNHDSEPHCVTSSGTHLTLLTAEKMCASLLQMDQDKHFQIPIENLQTIMSGYASCGSNPIISQALKSLRDHVAIRFSIDKSFSAAAISRPIENPNSLLDAELQDSPVPNGPSVRGWSSVPIDIHEYIFSKLLFEDVFRSKLVSRQFRESLESTSFQFLCENFNPQKCLLTAPYFLLKDGTWHCAGYDLFCKLWRMLPPLTYLPAPDSELFKEYLVCASSGLMCINVSKTPHKERLLVVNPLTKKTTVLPPLHHRRNPVLMHMMVDPVKQSFRVLVAGSSKSGDGHLSRKTEEFDSCTWQWKTTCDLPGPEFGLNEYQTGVCVGGIVYCIAFLEGESGRGILTYNVEKGEWVSNWTCPLPFSRVCNIVQLVESNGEVYLFSEREHGRNVEHCIDILETTQSIEQAPAKWRNVVKELKIGDRSLQIYPEFTCVPYDEGRLCVFNTIQHTGVIYDIQSGKRSEILLPPPPAFRGESFFSLNPLSFTFKPSFKIQVPQVK